MNKDRDLHEDEGPVEREENTTYTGDITNDGEFVGRDRIEGDRVEGNQFNEVYQEPEYEYPVNDGDTLSDNVINWLLSLFSEELLYRIYDKVDNLPLRIIMVGYCIIAGGTSLYSLISNFSLGLYVFLLAIPLIPIIAAMMFKLRLEIYNCPFCGPFTVRREKRKIVGKPLMRVDYLCTECGKVVDSNLYELESQNHSPSR